MPAAMNDAEAGRLGSSKFELPKMTLRCAARARPTGGS